VRRQPGGGLELPREVGGVEADDRGHACAQGRAAVEVLLDILLYRPARAAPAAAPRPARALQPAGR